MRNELAINVAFLTELFVCGDDRPTQFAGLKWFGFSSSSSMNREEPEQKEFEDEEEENEKEKEIVKEDRR